MSFESPKKETKADLEKEYREDMDELTAKYPTVESIVDHYRSGMIDFGEVSYRFPNKEDQEEVIRLSNERNEVESTDNKEF